MLFLLFQLGQDRYALAAAQVAEVLPLVRLKQLPQAPRGVAGVFNHRGTPVPVIDLCEWTLGRPAQARLSTRLILVHYSGATGGDHLLGLIAEKATGTLQRAPSDFVTSGVTTADTPYLGPVATDERGMIQRIEVNQLLPAAVREALFQPAAEAR